MAVEMKTERTGSIQLEKSDQFQGNVSLPESREKTKQVAETRLQQQTQVPVHKQLLYEVSLGWKQAGGSAWWTKIEPLNLYLGAIPLKNMGHGEQIAGLGVTKVLSLVEDFELRPGYLNTPMKAEEWKEKGIGTKQIPAVDFRPLTQEEIKTGVEELALALKEGHTVYVHCKAGHGRSATVVIAYLMQHQMLSFDEAFGLVKKLRPEINLNPGQKQAVLDYFAKEEKLSEKIKEPAKAEVNYANYLPFTEEKLTNTLTTMLSYVIDGGSYALGQHAPQAVAGFVPSINVESTLSRRNRYLREYEGDQNAAIEAAISRNHTYARQAKILAAGVVPFIGGPTSYSISLWHQLREIALIAAVHGHDVHDPEVQKKMLMALVGGDLLKIPAASVDLVARKIIKHVLAQAGLNALTPTLPAHLIFNFFTDNAGKVSTHAKAVFAGEHSKPVAAKEYMTKVEGA